MPKYSFFIYLKCMFGAILPTWNLFPKLKIFYGVNNLGFIKLCISLTRFFFWQDISLSSYKLYLSNSSKNIFNIFTYTCIHIGIHHQANLSMWNKIYAFKLWTHKTIMTKWWILKTLTCEQPVSIWQLPPLCSIIHLIFLRQIKPGINNYRF